MNAVVDASPETVQAVIKAMQLAAILDDRVAKPDKARIAGWSEQIHRHKLTEADLLDAVQAFYDAPNDRAIGVGDLIGHGRAARKDRFERQTLEEIEAHRDAVDARLPLADDDEIRPAAIPATGARAEVMAAMRGHSASRRPLKVPCSWCRAAIGRPCTAVGTGQPLRADPPYHSARLDALEAAPSDTAPSTRAPGPEHVGSVLQDLADQSTKRRQENHR